MWSCNIHDRFNNERTFTVSWKCYHGYWKRFHVESRANSNSQASVARQITSDNCCSTDSSSIHPTGISNVKLSLTTYANSDMDKALAAVKSWFQYNTLMN